MGDRLLTLYLETGSGSGTSIPILVKENETVKDVIWKVIKQASLPSDLKERALEALNEESQIAPYIIDMYGQKQVISFKDQVARVMDTYGTSQLNLDLTRLVGI